MVQYWVIVFSKLVILQTKVKSCKVNKLMEPIWPTIRRTVIFTILEIQKKVHTLLKGGIYNPCPFLQDKV